MLSGDNGILQRATDAKVKTEKAQIIEKAQTDILGQQAENKGTNITKGQLAKILNTYFKPTVETSIPDKISTTNDLVLKTLDDKYNINLSQIYTGSFEKEQAKWTYNHDTQTVTNGTLTLNIGDYINDTETTVEGFDGKWRVLGEENGQLLLVTATYYAPFAEDTTNGIARSSSGSVGPDLYGLQLSGKDGYDNGVARLNKIGEQYNNSKLEKGRSINPNDINKITGYNPNNTGVNDPGQTGTGTPFGNGNAGQYKNKVTYTFEGGKVWYQGTNAATTKTQSYYTTFKLLGETNNISSPTQLESTAYVYYPTTLTETSDDTKSVGLAKGSVAYNMLFTPRYKPYWLASPCVYAGTGFAIWSLFFVPSSCVTYNYSYYSGSISFTFGVRPAVSLKSNITPTFVSKDNTTNISTYEI